MPSIEYFAHWHFHKHLMIEACEHYQKRTWRNKTAILGPDEPLFLTVPLRKGKHQQVSIREVEISYDESWHRIHFSGMQSAYGKTAFFEELEEDLHGILFQNPKTLWELNVCMLDFFIDVLGGSWEYAFTSEFIPSIDVGVTDLRSGIPAGNIGSAALKLPVYSQVHRLNKTHLPNLSILDVLCHLGPGTMAYLSEYARQRYASPC